MAGLKLTPRQNELRTWAADTFRSICGDAYATYSRHPDQRSRFQATRDYYARLIQAGMLKAFLPQSVGGTLKSWFDLGIILEETQAVDSSLTIHLLATALGLLSLIIGGTDEQKKRILKPFVSGEGDPLAGLPHSEPGGLRIIWRREDEGWR
jgi:nitroalkane oxidase